MEGQALRYFSGKRGRGSQSSWLVLAKTGDDRQGPDVEDERPLVLKNMWLCRPEICTRNLPGADPSHPLETVSILLGSPKIYKVDQAGPNLRDSSGHVS